MKFQLTTQWISDTFDKYNNMYWEGKLRKPTFEICHTKTILGQFKHSYGQWLIRISDKYDRTEKEYTNTLLHEMCHVYIRQNNLKDTNRHHGKLFYSEADRINKYGWHIARTDSVAGCGLTNKDGVEYYMAAFKDKNGRYFLMGMNKNKISYFKKRFTKYYNYYKEWFVFSSTNDKKYATFTKCIKSCRGKYISEEEFLKLKKEHQAIIKEAV